MLQLERAVVEYLTNNEGLFIVRFIRIRKRRSAEKCSLLKVKLGVPKLITLFQRVM